MPDFSGKKVVVTGCSSGVGAAAVIKLAVQGATVIGVDRVASTDPAITHMVIGDLSTHHGVRAIADQITGPIDVLINNAGVAATLPWRTVLSINTLAPRDLTRALLPKFGPEPVIVTTASQAGFKWQQNFARLNAFLAIDDWDTALDSLADFPDIDTACYNLSKEAAIINSGNLAVDAKHIGLRSNSVSPGTIGTPLLADFTATMGAENIDGAAMWAGRHAHAEEIADALLFLASSESSWVSGADIPVDGGLSSMVFRNYIAPAMAAAAQ
ncbi:NAD(P)-dependent dehydrogenase (short-subunit alcohol dehydrogenase family) [Rhodococcus sp. OK519]|uniref:SDR family oxidoreductase n=1 Tax=Rhodococcus sp. OK519 TaxID=2135729 RepID=UPI000D35C160|nr:NAD(P)-dependent dehydrogenase (short-subunit alcohol dehydrogenase family) [Rhodococcus sp. OK519]